MTTILAVIIGLQSIAIAWLLLRNLQMARHLKSYDRIADAEQHLAACAEQARMALEQQKAAAAEVSAGTTKLDAIKSAIAHYQQILGPAKTAVELQTQIATDTAKVKQLSAALGKFENALQLKAYLQNQEETIRQAKNELDELQARIGTSYTFLELRAQIERGTVKMQKLAATIGNLEKASELEEFLARQQASIRAHSGTLDSLRHAIGAARKVAELQALIEQHQARIQQLSATIGGLERVPQLGSYLQQQELRIQQNNAQLADFAQAIGNARTASEIAAQVTYFQNYLAVLKADVGSLEEARGLQEFGFYRARYDFDSSEKYEERLETIRDRQKSMLKKETACACASEWTVNGDKREGKKMTDKQIKLMLRAFNGECDAAVGKARYNNVVSLEKRIQKAFEQINKLGETQQTSITSEFCRLKFEELHLVYEFQKKKEEEKETQRALKEQMKEEEKAAKEIERALDEAEREEEMKTMALEKARRELEQKTNAAASAQQLSKLEALVSRLENEIKDVIDRKVKATARAQLTKSGHVYILSNIGTLGEGVYKIGMSRRFDPLDRVAELGSASVPFPFDVHAMIYCPDAPALENMLHRRFADRRVNMINLRREFFQVSLDEIRAAVAECHGHVTFLTIPEAAQYRETLALRKEMSVVAAPLQIA
ncbi:DUF4041 domain-containing protein [Anatilimnocola floriformis]|uniref:DUF4041 domain-containing protein n=1 Tax=Anatilimnocola floriformis TaxID=2948575 RepID=UPI0020C55C97|nr:DUF4041 domain-containing protein [Anatilimnocola floriformis]